MIERKIEKNHKHNVPARGIVTAPSTSAAGFSPLACLAFCFILSTIPFAVAMKDWNHGGKLLGPKGFIIFISVAAVLLGISVLLGIAACCSNSKSTSDCKKQVKSSTALHQEPTRSEQTQSSSDETPPPSYEDAIKNAAHSKTTVINSNTSITEEDRMQSNHSLNVSHTPSGCNVVIHHAKPSESEQRQSSSNETMPPSHEDAIKNAAHSKITVTNGKFSHNKRREEQSKNSLKVSHPPSCSIVIHNAKNVFYSSDITIFM